MKAYDATAEIKASPETIWAILTDAPGERIKVLSKANPGRAFPVKVTEFAPGQRMTCGTRKAPSQLVLRDEWRTILGFGVLGVATASTMYYLAVDRLPVAVALLIEYTGPLLPMIWRSMPDLGPSFRQFANGLKQRAER